MDVQNLKKGVHYLKMGKVCKNSGVILYKFENNKKRIKLGKNDFTVLNQVRRTPGNWLQVFLK